MVKRQNHDISPDKNGQLRPNIRDIDIRDIQRDSVPPNQNFYLMDSVAHSDPQDV